MASNSPVIVKRVRIDDEHAALGGRHYRIDDEIDALALFLVTRATEYHYVIISQ